jgi:hypothetical protein
MMVLAFTAMAKADPKDDVKAAVQKLVDSPNYSWTTTVAAPAGGGGRRGGRGFGGGGPTAGKASKEGYVLVSLTMMQQSYDIITRGDKAMIKTDAGWKTPEELAAAPAGDQGGGFNPATIVAAQAKSIKSPTQQAMESIDKLQNVQKTDDAYTADMNPDEIKSAVTARFSAFARGRGGDAGAAPQVDLKDIKGSFKFWIKDGIITKVEMHQAYTMNFNGNDVPVDNTSTTEIKDVGTTKIEIPDDVKAKLS